MVEDLFTRDRIEAMRPEIQRIVDDVLDAIVKKGCTDGPVDLIEEFATPIPTRIVYGILGVPEEDIPELSKASAIRVSTSGSASDGGDKHLHDYMTSLVNKRIQAPGNPKDDLISKLVVEQYRPGHVTRDDIQRLAYLVLVAGNAAVISSIGLGVFTLLQQPEQLNVLKEDSSSTTATAVTEEVLRYHTPSALNSRRVAKRDANIGGKVRTFFHGFDHVPSDGCLLCLRSSKQARESLVQYKQETATRTCLPTPTILTFDATLTRTKTLRLVMVRTDAKRNGFRE